MNSHPLNSGAIIGHWFLNLPRRNVILLTNKAAGHFFHKERTNRVTKRHFKEMLGR